MYYNDVEEMGFSEIFMAGLMSNNYTELYERMSLIFSDEELNKFMGDVMNMLKKNTDYEYISEISGKSIEEIKEIEEIMMK